MARPPAGRDVQQRVTGLCHRQGDTAAAVVGPRGRFDGDGGVGTQAVLVDQVLGTFDAVTFLVDRQDHLQGPVLRRIVDGRLAAVSSAARLARVSDVPRA